MRTHASRRDVLAAIAGAALLPTRASGAKDENPSLAAIAAKNGMLFGAAIGPVIDTDAAYRQLYIEQTKIVTTDIALKMSRVAPGPGPLRFEAADKLLKFCSDHRIALRGHCLIWNEWVPGWIKALTAQEREKFFDSYIEQVVGRYAGRLQSWDVVNEPFWPDHKAPGGFRLGPWYDTFGTDYVRRAYVRARAADPRTAFVLNEAQAERDDALGLAVRQGLLKLIDDLQHAGVSLQAIGLQAHLQPRYPHDHARFIDFVHQIAARKLDIYLTEFDVRDDTFPDDVQSRDAAVADTTRRFLGDLVTIPAVKMLITWQLADQYSFYRDIYRQKNPGSTRSPRPLPYDEQLQRKPMWYAMADSLAQAKRA